MKRLQKKTGLSIEKLMPMLADVQAELKELRYQNVQIKMLKEAENKHMGSYIGNCVKVLHIVKEK